MTDLVETLTAAATEAIRNEAPDLRRDPEWIESVHLELYVNSRGRVDDGPCYVERMAEVGRD